MFNIDFDLDGLEDMLESLEALKELDGEYKSSDIFTESFMTSHSDFASIEKMFEASPWDIETSGDINSIPDSDLNEFVSEQTDFESWDAMTQEAFEGLLEQKISS
jgi:hypothetical protein